MHQSPLSSQSPALSSRGHGLRRYVRYDFSHPFGEHLDRADPRLLAGDAADMLRREWDVIHTLERSRAVLSSRLGSRLAHRRRVQLALASTPGAVEKYLGNDLLGRPRSRRELRMHI